MEKKQPLKIVFRLPKPQQQPTSTTTDQTQCPLHPRKRKSSSKSNAFAAKKKICINKQESKNLEWGYSTDLVLYDDPWNIKKTLTQTDLSDRWLIRLLISADIARTLILRVLGVQTDDEVLTNEGFQVGIWDVNTEYEHKLNFKLWKKLWRLYFQ